MTYPEDNKESAAAKYSHGYELADEAYSDFAAWAATQPEEVQEMCVIEQIDLYYASFVAKEAGR